MSHTYAKPFSLRLNASARLRGLVLGLHGLALLAVALSQIPAWLIGLTELGVLGSALVYARRLRQAPAVELTVWPEAQLSWRSLAGDTQRAQLLPSTQVTRHWIALCMQDDCGRQQAWLLLPDSLALDGFRRLCVYLRTQVFTQTAAN